MEEEYDLEQNEQLEDLKRKVAKEDEEGNDKG